MQAVRPDLLGEALVAQTLLRSSATNLLDAVLDKYAHQSMHRHALTVLTRLSKQYYDLHETLGGSAGSSLGHCYHDIVAVATETSNNLSVLAESAFARLTPSAKPDFRYSEISFKRRIGAIGKALQFDIRSIIRTSTKNQRRNLKTIN
ncbi:MAG: hypothetical protein IPH22_12185 [Nitrosomonas sp.]|nr:hypothetical protein [Nitrosomonas sp.]